MVGDGDNAMGDGHCYGHNVTRTVGRPVVRVVEHGEQGWL